MSKWNCGWITAIYLTLLTSALFPSEKEEMGGERSRGAFCSAPLHKLMWRGGGFLYMVLITTLYSHGRSRYVFMYGSNIMCAQHEEGQRDGGVFPCGKWTHPINSPMFTSSCLTPNEMNVSKRFYQEEEEAFSFTISSLVIYKMSLNNIFKTISTVNQLQIF